MNALAVSLLSLVSLIASSNNIFQVNNTREILKQNDSIDIETFGLWNSTYGGRGTKVNLLEQEKYRLFITEEDGFLGLNIDSDDYLFEDTCTIAVKTNFSQFIGDDYPIRVFGNINYSDTLESNGWYYIQGIFIGSRIEIQLSTYQYSQVKSIKDKFYVMLYQGDDLPVDSFYTNDNIAPYIVKKDSKFNHEIECSYASKVSQEEIFDYYDFIDNFKLTVNPSLIGYDKYLNSTSIEDFKLSIMVSDGLGSTRFQDFVIHQIDDVTPVIKGPDKVYKSSKKTFSFDDIKLLYSVEDISDYQLILIDGDSDGKHLYGGNAYKNGDYVVRLNAIDIYDNIGVKKVDIAVYDTIAPVVMYDNTILVDSNVILELNDFIQLLKVQKIINEKYTNEFTIVEDTYTSNARKSGTYNYKIKIRSSSGEQVEHDFKVKVDSLTPSKIENKKTWIDEVNNFFKSIGDWIWFNCFKPIAKLFGYKER